MKNKKYTIKYSKSNRLEYSNTNTNTPTHETQLTNTHPLIKTSIRKALATCLTFSLVVSIVGYAQALNKTGEDNSSKDNVSFIETTSPHYIAIKNFQTQKENYWDINNLGNISLDRIFYVDMSKMVENNDEPVYNFSDMSIQYSGNPEQSEPEQPESKTSTYRYAYLIHLTDSERHVVESIVAGESGNQPFVGKKLVCQAIYNGMLRDNMSPSQVRKQYSYDGYKDIDEFEKECLKAYGTTNAADECRQAVKEIFDNYSMPTDDFVLFFYAPAHSKGTWHENAKTLKPITYVNEDGSTTNYIGGHKFFALKDEPVINYTREG
uniref:Spore cortex-lytic enzyme, lytic transglycosylase n=1 Tax=Siphoviridae sp. ctLqe90 TaxID=2825456 RepID=A0A8S5Q3L9_9CAUD|nr:MAG TPA: Spore cortex-lytic enzyme, lytic transglycosylase [Siphoviridae sp. ctLqe90]